MSNKETIKFKGYTMYKEYEKQSKAIIPYADVIAKCTGVALPKDLTTTLIGNGENDSIQCSIGFNVIAKVHTTGDLSLTVYETPKKHLAHSRRSTYRSVTTAWDLCKLLGVILGENNIKPHVDKYIEAMNSCKTKSYSEMIEIIDPSELRCKAYPCADVVDVKVEISSVLSSSSSIPRITCMYKLIIRRSDMNVEK